MGEGSAGVEVTAARAESGWLKDGRRLGVGIAVLVVWTLLFLPSLSDMVRYALSSDLYSHVLLVPVICGYLGWQAWRAAAPRWVAAWGWTAALGLLAAILALGAGRWVEGHPDLARDDRLFVMLGAYVVGLWALACGWLGREGVRTTWFGLALLLFLVPMPVAVERAATAFLQNTSADVSYHLIRWTGTNVYRVGNTFEMPGLTILVAEQCSGLRSTFVLFLTALVAGALFLKSGWGRVILVLSFIPVGIVRNSLRIGLIAWVGVHVDPGVLDGPIHKHGGPPFFVLSIFMLLGILKLIQRVEQRAEPSKAGGGAPERLREESKA